MRGRRSRTCCSSPSRRRSASSPPRWSRARWSSGCASAPFLVFAALWSVLVYGVLAHWAFGGGWLQAQGTLDFAGGIPVEMGSGFSALAAALVVGARQATTGARRCSRTTRCYVLLGAGLLWFGWFGFNGGSGFSTGNAGVLAFVNTLLTPACALATWFVLDLLRSRQVTAIGAATAIVVGCVGHHARGRASSRRCGRWCSASWRRCRRYAVIMLPPRSRVDETLDVLAAHGVAGPHRHRSSSASSRRRLERGRRRPLLRRRRPARLEQLWRCWPPRPTRSRRRSRC